MTELAHILQKVDKNAPVKVNMDVPEPEIEAKDVSTEEIEVDMSAHITGLLNKYKNQEFDTANQTTDLVFSQDFDESIKSIKEKYLNDVKEDGQVDEEVWSSHAAEEAQDAVAASDHAAAAENQHFNSFSLRMSNHRKMQEEDLGNTIKDEKDDHPEDELVDFDLSMREKNDKKEEDNILPPSAAIF
mgnify:CR=1 FL=1